MKRNIMLLLGGLMLLSSACFDEKEDEYKIVGAVGTITVLTPSKTAPASGESITVKVRYYSDNIEARALRLFETVGTGSKTLVSTKVITDFDTRNSYEEIFDYNTPAVTPKTKVVLTVEIETINDLVNSKTSTIEVQ